MMINNEVHLSFYFLFNDMKNEKEKPEVEETNILR